MTKNQEILELQDLIVNFYTYEGKVEALDGVNLKMREGETLGLVGETGCGKSVTSLATLVLVPAPGKIEGGNARFRTNHGIVDLTKQNDATLRGIRGKDIAMIFQDPRSALNPVYTVENQLAEVFMHHRLHEMCQRSLDEIEKDLKKKSSKAFFYRMEKNFYQKMSKNPKAFSLRIVSRIPIVNRYKRRIGKEIRKEVVKTLKTLKIPDPERVADMYPHELSGGMAQRVVIAMALGCSPGLLIADEPTTNLDVTIQAQILEQVRELKDKFESSILYITHDLGVVAEVCDRVAVMYAGNVVEIAEVEEIFKHPLHPYTQALLGSIPRPGKGFAPIEGEVPSLIAPPPGCRFNPRCQKGIEICNQQKPKLIEADKDHFVMCHLYGEGS